MKNHSGKDSGEDKKFVVLSEINWKAVCCVLTRVELVIRSIMVKG